VIRRRQFLAGAAALTAAARAAPARADDEPFSRSVVLQRARALAAEPFAAPEPAVPESLLDMSASEYRGIRFREDRRLFVDPPSGFAVELLHSGFVYNLPVEMFVIADGLARKLAYDPALFTFDGVDPPEPGTLLEFAGFRALTGLERADVLQAFALYAGASYFQAISKGQRFGLSARGIAIGTGEAEGEEFPFFRAHWLEPPGDGRMVVHSLLDGPSATGAFRFTLRPGDVTQIDVEATIFARADIAHVGLAPMTSMFLFDAKERAEHDDFRPAVHDSDGLALWNGAAERLWRPLHAPRLLQISYFSDAGPKGFGLIQRERRFSEYEDLAAAFHKRPSLWVEPIGDWGRGHVVLVEIPTTDEVHDNIVAYWRPEAPVTAGSEFSLTYRLSWPWDAPDLGGRLRVVRTLIGAGGDERRRFVIDFAGDVQNRVPASAVTLGIKTNPGTVQESEVAENPETAGLRVSFELDPEGAESVEMRLDLRSGERTIAETWIYRWSI
jgi:glucans biosynthesis protein